MHIFKVLNLKFFDMYYSRVKKKNYQRNQNSEHIHHPPEFSHVPLFSSLTLPRPQVTIDFLPVTIL